MEGADFLAFDLEPLAHSASSAAAPFWFSTAAFWAAESAFWMLCQCWKVTLREELRKMLGSTFALPAAFLVFSPACFLGIAVASNVSENRVSKYGIKDLAVV